MQFNKYTHVHTHTYRIMKSGTVHGISNVADDFVFKLGLVMMRSLTLIVRRSRGRTRAGNVHIISVLLGETGLSCFFVQQLHS